jgi:putative acetyltransferase
MTYSPEITLHAFQPADQAAVKDLILAGLADHWGTLDPSKNPDLDDIAASYAGAIFLVARYLDRIIGTGALVPRPDGTAEVVRMSVSADWRRQGIGRMILRALVDHARQNGFQRIVLETTETWQEVIAFYLHFGFRITHYQDGDVYFELDLERNL